MRGFRSYAIVPAAGQSRRMERPKQSLPWGDATLLGQVLAAWRRSAVDEIVVVARRDDGMTQAVAAGERTTVVRPDVDPPDMKASVLAALRHLESTRHPDVRDAWLLAPADLPFLAAAVIDRMLATHATGHARILVPTLAGHRGHPLLVPWAFATDVESLGPGQGIRDLMEQRPCHPVQIEPRDVLPLVRTRMEEPGEQADAELADAVWRFRCDVDTPAQYREALRMMRGDARDGGA